MVRAALDATLGPADPAADVERRLTWWTWGEARWLAVAALVLCGFACSAPENGSHAASEASANKNAGRIAFGIVVDPRTPRGAPQTSCAHWDAGGAWNVPTQPIWSLEEPLLQCRVERAAKTVDDLGFAALELTLDARDAPAFHALGERAAGRRLAVLVDGRVVVTPRVKDPLGATFEIAGNFSKRDVELLLEHLRPSAQGKR